MVILARYDVLMRTTIDLPESLLRQVKARAALEGTTFKRLIRSFVEQGLRHEKGRGSDRELKMRSEIPTISRPIPGTAPPDLSNSELYELLEKEDIAREQRACRFP